MTKTNKAAAAKYTEDDLGFLQIASSEVLAAVARGELNLNDLAKRELAARGLDWNAKWVGFEKAANLSKMHAVRNGHGRIVAVSVPE